MMRFALAMFATAALAVSPAHAEKPASEAPKQEAGKKGSDRMICRTEDEIGSLVKKKKICLTAAQWSEASHESGMRMEHTQVNNSGIRSGN